MRNLNSINIDSLLCHSRSFDLDYIFNLHNVDEIAEALNEHCIILLDLYAPYKKISKKKYSKYPFMKSEEIKNAKALRDLAYFEFRNSIQRSDEQWKHYCCLRNKVTKLIKAKKKEFSKIFFNVNSTKTLWNKIKSTGVANSSKKEVLSSLDLNLLNKHFCGIANGGIFCPSFSSTPSSEDAFYFRNIDIDELWFCLNNIKSNAVGSDDIPLKFLKISFPVMGIYWLHLINSILTKSCFPKCRKMALVNPIQKKTIHVVSMISDLFRFCLLCLKFSKQF